MANVRAKRSNSWDTGILVKHVLGTFDIAAFKVMLGSFGAVAIAGNTIFKRCFFYTYSFSTKPFIGFPCDNPHKVISWDLEI